MGYVRLNDISGQLHKLQNSVSHQEDDLATSALVLMVRGATSDLRFPLAAFSTNALDSRQLYTIVWSAIELLEIKAG